MYSAIRRVVDVPSLIWRIFVMYGVARLPPLWANGANALGVGAESYFALPQLMT